MTTITRRLQASIIIVYFDGKKMCLQQKKKSSVLLSPSGTVLIRLSYWKVEGSIFIGY